MYGICPFKEIVGEVKLILKVLDRALTKLEVNKGNWVLHVMR
jgi:hypothetical protein